MRRRLGDVPLPWAVVRALAWGLIAVPFTLPGMAWELGWVRPPERAVVPARVEAPNVPEHEPAGATAVGPAPNQPPESQVAGPDADCPGAPLPTGGVEGPGETALRGKAPMTFVKLRGGAFTMGSERGGRDDERPCRRVELDGFELAAHEVTNAQWRAVMGEKPPSDCSGACPEDAPVTDVSWGDSIDFLNRLSRLEKRTECYRKDAQGRVAWERSCDGYRLPTEAEWEYAARAGKVGAYGFDGGEAVLDKYAWYGDGFGGRAHPVGKKEPNEWGFHDMHGNVWEWVWDKYGPYHSDGNGSVNIDDEDGNIRVLRGGAFYYAPALLRSAYREWFRPMVRYWDLGLRVARGFHPNI